MPSKANTLADLKHARDMKQIKKDYQSLEKSVAALVKQNKEYKTMSKKQDEEIKALRKSTAEMNKRMKKSNATLEASANKLRSKLSKKR